MPIMTIRRGFFPSSQKQLRLEPKGKQATNSKRISCGLTIHRLNLSAVKLKATTQEETNKSMTNFRFRGRFNNIFYSVLHALLITFCGFCASGQKMSFRFEWGDNYFLAG